jgi:hypothetical protein
MNKLDPEEKDILEAFEGGKLKTVKNRARELGRHRKAAEANLCQGQPDQHPHFVQRPPRAPKARAGRRDAVPDARIERAAQVCGRTNGRAANG